MKCLAVFVVSDPETLNCTLQKPTDLMTSSNIFMVCIMSCLCQALGTQVSKTCQKVKCDIKDNKECLSTNTH